MRTRNGRRKVLFGTNYPMIFHEPALPDLDALALDDEARELYLSADAQGALRRRAAAPALPRRAERARRRVGCPQRTRSSSTGNIAEQSRPRS